MEFINIFETENELNFKEVTELFDERSIRYGSLHEYRLYTENRYDIENRIGGAIIRIHPHDLKRATECLKEQGYSSADELEDIGAIRWLKNLFRRVGMME